MGIAEHAGALPAGTRVGDFQIDHVIGHPGHFGVTYVARDSQQRKVALKEYFPVEIAQRDGETLKLKRDEDAGIYKWGLRGFLEECEQLVRFAHPSVVKGHQAFEANGTAYFAMEYIEGESLAELLQREGRMGESRLRSFLMPVVDGVRHAHEAGLLHRDICPTDIRIAADGHPVLTDFAGARNVLRFKSKSVAHAFTPGYAPPEEYIVTGKQGPWTDVYSLAGVAYRAVTGQAPVDAPARQKGTPMKPASELAAGRYPEDFLYAIDWGMRLDAAQRPQKVVDWQAALDGTLPVPVFDAAPAPAAPPVEAPPAPMPVPTIAVPIEPRRPAEPRPAAAPRAAGPDGHPAAAPSADAPAPGRSGVPMWAIAAGAGVLVVVGALFALRGGKTTAPVEPQAAAPAADQAAPPADVAAAPAAGVPADGGAAGAAPAEEELSGLDRIALQLMQQEQEAKVKEAEQAELKAAEDAERAKREQAAKEQAAREQAAVQKKLEEEQNDARRKQLEQEQARLKAEEEARLKAEAERAAAPPTVVASAQPPAAGFDAVPQKAPDQCRIHVSQLTETGRLTYRDAKRAKGAVVDPETGVIRLPPVPIAGGRRAVFEIQPDGCARIVRQ